MPIMDGVICTKRIREFEEKTERPHVPILALTGIYIFYISQSLSPLCKNQLTVIFFLNVVLCVCVCVYGHICDVGWQLIQLRGRGKYALKQAATST